MRKLILSAVFLLVPLSAFSADLSDFVVAKVNNKAITYSEINDRCRFVTIISKLNIKDKNEQKILRNQVIDKMVDEELIRQEATRLKIELTDQEINNGIEIVAIQHKQTPEKFKALLKKNHLSFENYSRQIESEILWSKIISETLRHKVQISEAEVREFLEQHKLDTDVRKFFLAEVLISPSENAAEFSNKLALELRSGADFSDVVKQFSSGVDHEIGWVSQSDIDKKIYAAIAKMGKGDYSDPVQLEDGYHIFKLVDSKVENKVADQDLNAAKNAIFHRKLQILAKGDLMELRKKAFVEIKDQQASQ